MQRTPGLRHSVSAVIRARQLENKLTIHEAPLHPLSVIELLHEAGMLPHARDVERLYLGTNTVHEVIVFDGGARDGALDFRVVCNATVSLRP